MAWCWTISRLLGAGCLAVVCWAPLLALGVVFVYVSSRNIASNAHPTCEVPLHAWAEVSGCMVLVVSILTAIGYIESTFMLVDVEVVEAQLAQRATKAGNVPTDDKDLQKPGVSRWLQCCGQTIVFREQPLLAASNRLQLALSVIIGILTTFLLVWVIIGAFWTFPLRNTEHHCDPVLFSLSFYFIAIASVAVVLVVLLVGVLSCCALIFTMSVGAAISNVTGSIRQFMSLDFLSRSKERPEPASSPDSPAETPPVTPGSAVVQRRNVPGSARTSAPAAAQEGPAEYPFEP